MTLTNKIGAGIWNQTSEEDRMEFVEAAAAINAKRFGDSEEAPVVPAEVPPSVHISRRGSITISPGVSPAVLEE